MAFVIIKESGKPYTGGRGYAGVACVRANVQVAKIYDDFDDALSNCNKLSLVSSECFTVVEYRMELMMNDAEFLKLIGNRAREDRNFDMFLVAPEILRAIVMGDESILECAKRFFIRKCDYCGEQFFKKMERQNICGKPECHKERGRIVARNRYREKLAKKQFVPFCDGCGAPIETGRYCQKCRESK